MGGAGVGAGGAAGAGAGVAQAQAQAARAELGHDKVQAAGAEPVQVQQVGRGAVGEVTDGVDAGTAQGVPRPGRDVELVDGLGGVGGHEGRHPAVTAAAAMR